MHPVLKSWWESVRIAAGTGPLLRSALFWAVAMSALAMGIFLAAAGAPWHTLAIVPGMVAGMLWFGVFFKVAHHSPDALLAFVGGLFLLGLLLDIIFRYVLR